MNQQSCFGRCCCLLFFMFISLTALAAAILVILFILKPKKPVFHLRDIHLDPLFKLDVASTEDGSISLPMVSLLFVTRNPNKLGIRYSSTDLMILYESNPVGLISVPAFYQPPHSGNVTIIVHAMFDRINITEFLSIVSKHISFDGNPDHIQIIGSIRVQGHILMFSLPKIKVSLVCKIGLNFADLLFNKVNFPKARKALLSNFPHLSQKCTLALDL